MVIKRLGTTALTYSLVGILDTENDYHVYLSVTPYWDMWASEFNVLLIILAQLE